MASWPNAPKPSYSLATKSVNDKGRQLNLVLLRIKVSPDSQSLELLVQSFAIDAFRLVNELIAKAFRVGHS